MTPSEAFAAWIDGKRVQVESKVEWVDVSRFEIGAGGLVAVFDTGKGPAAHRTFRLTDAPTEPKPTVEDSEAWVLLRELVSARESGTHRDIVYASVRAKRALKKRGML